MTVRIQLGILADAVPTGAETDADVIELLREISADCINEFKQLFPETKTRVEFSFIGHAPQVTKRAPQSTKRGNPRGQRT